MTAGPIDASDAVWRASTATSWSSRLAPAAILDRWGTALDAAGLAGRVTLILHGVGSLLGLAGILALTLGHGPAIVSVLSVVAIAIGARGATVLVLWLLSATARARITPAINDRQRASTAIGPEPA